MTNKLFQEVRRFVEAAEHTDPTNRAQAMAIARNALSSAYANSTEAEQRQLRDMQTKLDSLK
ncbi:MAG: DUF3813 domain-containing protein [Bacillus sp. (in: firmicutes)]